MVDGGSKTPGGSRCTPQPRARSAFVTLLSTRVRQFSNAFGVERVHRMPRRFQAARGGRGGVGLDGRIRGHRAVTCVVSTVIRAGQRSHLPIVIWSGSLGLGRDVAGRIRARRDFYAAVRRRARVTTLAMQCGSVDERRERRRRAGVRGLIFGRRWVRVPERVGTGGRHAAKATVGFLHAILVFATALLALAALAETARMIAVEALGAIGPAGTGYSSMNSGGQHRCSKTDARCPVTVRLPTASCDNAEADEEARHGTSNPRTRRHHPARDSRTGTAAHAATPPTGPIAGGRVVQLEPVLLTSRHLPIRVQAPLAGGLLRRCFGLARRSPLIPAAPPLRIYALGPSSPRSPRAAKTARAAKAAAVLLARLEPVPQVGARASLVAPERAGRRERAARAP